jgi:hypothetical protein
VAAVGEVNVLGWFSHEELRLCPLCRERAALPAEDGPPLICLRCGEPLASAPAASESA